MNDDEGDALLTCASCGASGFVFTADGRVLCESCGGLLAPYGLREAMPEAVVN